MHGERMTMLPWDKKALNEAVDKLYKDLGDPDSFCKGYEIATKNWRSRILNRIKELEKEFAEWSEGEGTPATREMAGLIEAQIDELKDLVGNNPSPNQSHGEESK